MSRAYSHINTAARILGEYRGMEPFPISLRSFFSANKKYGSRDRKQISQLCYSFLRAGHLLKGWELPEAIIAAVFLSVHEANDLISEIKPLWVDKCHWSFEEKCVFLDLSAAAIFPFTEKLSKKIDPTAFDRSLLIQPDLYVRIRPEQKETVINKLKQAGLEYDLIGKDCLRFLNSTRLEDILVIDKEVVVQDRSSQKLGEVLKQLDGQGIKKVWDCCAASGGKSILAWDLLGPLDLTVSDIRKNILANLEKRFTAAGITLFKRFQADISSPEFRTGIGSYHLLISDVPCTGSGTWSRTPEQLYFFKEEKIHEYQQLQRKIVSNTWASLKPGGYYLYITCSVFEMENEQQAAFIQQQLSGELILEQYLEGYNDKADTLYYALFKK